MDIGFNIKSLRKANGLSIKEVSEVLGMTYNSYRNYENGTRNPNINKLLKLAKLFDCSVEYIVTGDDPNSIFIYDIEEKISEIKLIMELAEKQILNNNTSANDVIYLKGYLEGIRQALKVMED